MVPHEMSVSMVEAMDIVDVVRIKSMTFEQLILTMIEKRTSTPGVDNYVIVAHGHHNAMDYAYGLSMPLMAGTTTKAIQDVLQPLVDFMNKDASDADMDDFEKKQNDPTVPADNKITVDDKGTPARYPKG